MLRFIELLWDTGFKLRCPVCEQGHLFESWFRMNPTCPHCNVRFERHQGEVVGGMTISVLVTSTIFMVGYLTSAMAFEWPLWLHFMIWIPFAVLFPVLFYRYSRALWVVLLHLNGSVHWDYEPYHEPRLSIVDAFLHREEEGSEEDRGEELSEDDDRPTQTKHKPNN